MVTAGAAPQIDSRRQGAAASVEVSSSSDDDQVPEIVQAALPTTRVGKINWRKN